MREKVSIWVGLIMIDFELSTMNDLRVFVRYTCILQHGIYLTYLNRGHSVDMTNHYITWMYTTTTAPLSLTTAPQSYL